MQNIHCSVCNKNLDEDYDDIDTFLCDTCGKLVCSDCFDGEICTHCFKLIYDNEYDV